MSGQLASLSGVRSGREQVANAQAVRRRRRLGPGKPIRFGAAIGPVLLLAIWSIGSAVGWIDPRVLSAPWTVVTTTGELIADGRLQSNLLTSAQRAFAGLGIGVVLGVALALAAGLSRWGEAVLDGPIQIKRAIPSLALMPLLILWLGIGESMKITTITLGVFVPIYLHTHNGLRSIDSRYVELAQTVGLSRSEFIRRVVLPGALPGFLLGLRFAVTGAWLSLVVVEQINSTSGIGYMMELARTYGQTDIIIVGLVLYGALGLLSDGVVRLIQRKALSWRRTLAD
jgi:sulfonate transport system permease protein